MYKFDLVGAIFEKRESMRIAHPPSTLVREQAGNTSSYPFALVFCMLDSAEKILREKYSKEAKECVQDFLDPLIEVLKTQVEIFSEIECQVLASMFEDLTEILIAKSSTEKTI